MPALFVKSVSIAQMKKAGCVLNMEMLSFTISSKSSISF